MNDFGLLVGRYFSSLPTLTDTQLSELQLDSLGRLIISGRFLEDSAHSSGDAGLQILAVRKDVEGSLVDTDGDYAPLQVDADGRLRVVADILVTNGHEKLEDAAHSSSDVGSFILAVRQDVLANSTSTDGDYAAFKVNTKGELYIHDVDANASLDNIETSVSNIDTSLNNIETDIAALKKLEDAVHSSGDAGIMALAVRHDAESALAADGDYTPVQTDSTGRVKVAAIISPTGAEQYTVTDALAAAGDGLATITASATPWVTVASLAHTSGTALIYGWQWACDQNAQARIVTDDTTDIIVYKTDLNSSAMPGTSEHFSEGGRIEIAGAASLEIKLQIKKRSATGGNASGTGSMHIRV